MSRIVSTQNAMIGDLAMQSRLLPPRWNSCFVSGVALIGRCACSNGSSAWAEMVAVPRRRGVVPISPMSQRLFASDTSRTPTSGRNLTMASPCSSV